MKIPFTLLVRMPGIGEDNDCCKRLIFKSAWGSGSNALNPLHFALHRVESSTIRFEYD